MLNQTASYRRPRRQYRDLPDYAALIIRTLQAADKPLSKREIALAMGYSKNARLAAVIAALVRAGRLVERQSHWRGRLMYVYEVA